MAGYGEIAYGTGLYKYDDSTSTVEIIDPFFPGNDDSYLSSLVKPGRKIEVWVGFELEDGSEEYTPYGTFWSNDWNTPVLSPDASTTGRDRMELLRNATFGDSSVYMGYTLYQLAEVVLNSAVANTPMPDLTWTIDPYLSNIIVPVGWFERKSYFDALKKISSACLGQVYMNRSDVLVIESYRTNIPTTATPDYQIDASMFFNRDNPVAKNEIINVMEVTTHPLSIPGSTSTVYESTDGITLQPLETRVIDVKYSTPPVSGGSASISDAGGLSVSITAAEYYAWGAVITVANASPFGGDIKLEIEGYQITEEGSITVTKTASDSKASNGVVTHLYEDNHLIQTETHADIIGTYGVLLYKEGRRDAVVTWMGHPAVELADLVEVPVYQKGAIDNKSNYIIYKQETRIDDDGLEITTSGREANVTDIPPTVYQDTDGASTEWQDTDTATDFYQDTDE